MFDCYLQHTDLKYLFDIYGRVRDELYESIKEWKKKHLDICFYKPRLEIFLIKIFNMVNNKYYQKFHKK